MPEPDKAPEGQPKPAPTLAVIVNPEDTVAIRIEPVFISLGLKPEFFTKEVGGNPQ